MFEDSIVKCFTDFVVIGNPIITWKDIDVILAVYKKSMAHLYNTFYKMLGFDKILGLIRNIFFKKSGYYDRLVFYNLLVMVIQRNNRIMVHWVMISAGANYARSIGEIMNRKATYLGTSTTTQTYLITVKPRADTMIMNVTNILFYINKTIWTLDNNQRGHPLKYQRFGSSNSLVKVTGRKCYKCLICEVIIGDEDEKRCPLAYIDQLTVNLINFSIFDKEITD